MTCTDKDHSKIVVLFTWVCPGELKGMLAHSFDRFYVVTKFEMPKIEDLKLTTFTFDFACRHLMSDKIFMQKDLKHCQRIKSKTSYFSFLLFQLKTKTNSD